jgi:hypothetical protein
MNIPPFRLPDTFTFSTHYTRNLSLKVGDIINAEVIEVMDSGSVSLRIIHESGQKTPIIIAKPDMPLSIGERLLLKVTDLGEQIRLQLMGMSNELKANDGTEAIASRIYAMLSDLSNSRLKSEDMRLLIRFFRSMPDAVKSVLPEINILSGIMPEIESLNQKLLKRSVEGSGVVFESRLKLLTAKELMDAGELAVVDAKGLILKIIGKLSDAEVINVLKMLGFDHKEMEKTLNRMLRNIEFFQLTSYINDLLYTFLPVSWYGLRDGELMFKRDKGAKGDSFTCRVYLSFERIGSLLVSVTLFNKAFYVTFYAEMPDTVEMILSAKALLEKRFIESGLLLNAVNVSQRLDIDPCVKGQGELDIRV